MAENVFDEKEDYLISAKNEVAKRDAMAAELEKMKTQQKKLVKNIAAEEKSIADEIAVTLKKRKQEIANSYDDRLDDNRARKKKVSSKRDKKKNQRMNQRIDNETKDIRENTRELEVEMKTLYKKNKVPSFCTSPVYFTMFMPHGTGEILGMVGCYLAFFGGIPAILTMLVKWLVLDKKSNINVAFWCAVISSVLVILQFVVFFVIYNTTKIRHSDVLKQGRCLRDKIKTNARQAEAIRDSINKDKDESIYKLDAYDEKLASLDAEADTIGTEKQEALKSFEEETKQLIIDEINGRRLQAVEDMKAEKKELDDKIAKGEKMYSDKVLQITNQYAPYLGEDLCKKEKLEDLIALMEEGQAATVSEAISLYKGKSSK